MQAHHDQARTTIAHDLGRLFGGIPEHDQRLRPKMRGDGFDELIEAFFGDGPSIGIEPRQVQPREQGALDRLDDVYQHERQVQRLRQAGGHTRLVK